MANRQEGIVVSVAGALAKVKTSRHNNCDSCGACPGNSAIVLEAQNPLHAQTGQKVELEIRDANMLQAAFIVFILPLIAACVGAWAGRYAAVSWGYETLGLTITGGALAFGLAIAYVKYFDKAAGANTSNQPVIIRIYDN